MNHNNSESPSSSSSTASISYVKTTLVCKDVEEIMVYKNLTYGPFSVDSSFGSEDGRFMFVVRFPSIIALDIRTGESWDFTNEDVKLIFGFISTIGNKGIIIYSPLQWSEFALSRQLTLAKVEFDFGSSLLKITESTPFTSENLIKQIELGHGGNRFVLLSEKSNMHGEPSSTFYIFSINDINNPIKKLTVQRVNDKVLFYHLIEDYIYFFDTVQVGLFEDVFFKKSVIRRLCIKSGTVTKVETNEFPECGNYISYGNRPWSVNGKWCGRILYLSTTLPFSNPEVRLFFSFDIDTCQWKRIIVEGLPSVRHNIVKPNRDIDRLHYLRDDRASLLINVVGNKNMIILQPRNWEHSELACFSVVLNDGSPDKLRVLARKAVLEKWPELKEMEDDELLERKLPSNLFSTFNII